MANIYKAPSVENYNTTLSNAVTSGALTMTLASVANLQVPTVLVIDRVDATGTLKSTASWEYVLATAINGNDVTITRGRGGSTAQAHSAGAVVEAVVTAEQWEGLRTWVDVLADDNGLLKAVISPVSFSRVHSDTFAGQKGQFVWTYQGALATSLATSATDAHLSFLRASKNLTINSVWAGVNSAPSTSYAEINLQYKSTPTSAPAAILTNMLYIDVGEYTSGSAATAATLALTSLASGNLVYPSIARHGDAGDLTISMICTERP